MAFFKNCLLVTVTIWVLSNQLVFARYQLYPKPWQDSCYSPHLALMDNDVPIKRNRPQDSSKTIVIPRLQDSLETIVIPPPNATSDEIVKLEPGAESSGNYNTVTATPEHQNKRGIYDFKFKRISKYIENFFKYVPTMVLLRPKMKEYIEPDELNSL